MYFLYRGRRFAAVITRKFVWTTVLLATQLPMKANAAIASESTAATSRNRVEVPLSGSRHWPDARTQVDIWHPPCESRPPHLRTTQRPPVIISNVGLRGKLAETSLLLETLAQSGYIVVAVGDVADLPDLTDPEDRAAQMISYRLSSEAELDRFKQLAERRSVLAADYVAAIVEWLKLSPTGLDDPRCPVRSETSADTAPDVADAPPVETLRLGLLGHSFGSSVLAVFAGRSDEDEAMVNLDGWLFASSLSQLEQIPYLALTGDLTHVTSQDVANGDTRISAYEARLNDEFLAWHKSSGRRLKENLRHIDGAIHADFSNEERSDQQRWKDWISGRDNQRSLARRLIIDQVARFFLTHLPQTSAADGQKVP